MKKLIAISVVFALVAGVAFAEISVGAGVTTKVELMKGSSGGGDIQSAARMQALKAELSGQDDEGKFGGYVRFDIPWWRWADARENASVYASGNAWWKPIDQFLLRIGGNGKDGFFGQDGGYGWGFYQMANDTVTNNDNWSGSGFYAGFSPLAGLMMEITPLDGLSINIGLPFWAGDGTNNLNYGAKAVDVFRNIHVQVGYNIGAIGQLAISYQGAARGSEATYAFFNLTAIENLGLAVGLGVYFPPSGGKVKIGTGLGASFNAGSFGVKARLNGTFTGSDYIRMEVDVLPSFAISDSLKVQLDAGIDYTKGDTVGWHVCPYLTVKSSWWSPSFFFGFRIDNGAPGTYSSTVNWSVPIGIAIGF